MSRRREISKRKILPDPIYGSQLLTKFINQIMFNGKKSVAEKIVYNALEIIKNHVKEKTSLMIFESALENAKPIVEVKSRRVGGSTYQVPIEVQVERSKTLAMRWLIESARIRKEKKMEKRLANEIIESFEGRSSTVKKRDNIHRAAEANKAFSHYRW